MKSGFLLYADIQPEGLAALDAAADDDASKQVLARAAPAAARAACGRSVLLDA